VVGGQGVRLYNLAGEAPALLCGTPPLPVGTREFQAEVSWDLPSLAPGATSLLDVTVTGCRVGGLGQARQAFTRFHGGAADALEALGRMSMEVAVRSVRAP
jgi:hypothetical protein